MSFSFNLYEVGNLSYFLKIIPYFGLRS